MNNQGQPLISVVMPVYNCEKYLRESMQSILGQTLADFELIVVDDGSTDGSRGILQSFAESDPRVIVITSPVNQGVSAALDLGMSKVRGRFIARMDADDISLPDRFSKQASYLVQHPETGVTGCSMRLIDEQGKSLGVLVSPQGDLAIHWTSLLSAAFYHVTLMFRRSLILDHPIRYRVGRDQSQDYDFISQLLEFSCGYNFREPMVIVRVHSASISSHFKQEKVNRKSRLILENLHRQFPDLAITHDEILLVSNMLLGMSSSLSGRARAAETYLRVWKAFASRWKRDEEFTSLQKEVALVALKLALFPPFQPGWLKVVRQVQKIEPGWFAYLLGRIPRIVSIKIQSSLIAKEKRKNSR